MLGRGGGLLRELPHYFDYIRPLTVEDVEFLLRHSAPIALGRHWPDLENRTQHQPTEEPMSSAINDFLGRNQSNEMIVPLDIAQRVAGSICGAEAGEPANQRFVAAVGEATAHANRDFSFPDANTIPHNNRWCGVLNKGSRLALAALLRAYMRGNKESRVVLFVASILSYVEKQAEQNGDQYLYLDEIERILICRMLRSLKRDNTDEGKLIYESLRGHFS